MRTPDAETCIGASLDCSLRTSLWTLGCLELSEHAKFFATTGPVPCCFPFSKTSHLYLTPPVALLVILRYLQTLEELSDSKPILSA